MAVRPQVAHACGVLREYGALYRLGRIDGAKWLAGIRSVLASVDQGLAPRVEASAALAAAARPAVADPSHERTAQHVRRLANRDTSNRVSVEGHRA